MPLAPLHTRMTSGQIRRRRLRMARRRAAGHVYVAPERRPAVPQTMRQLGISLWLKQRRERFQQAWAHALRIQERLAAIRRRVAPRCQVCAGKLDAAGWQERGSGMQVRLRRCRQCGHEQGAA